MNIQPPQQTPPSCCGQPAVWTVQSVNMAYYFCKECKKEVDPYSKPIVPWVGVVLEDKHDDNRVTTKYTFTTPNTPVGKPSPPDSF